MLNTTLIVLAVSQTDALQPFLALIPSPKVFLSQR
jgi:hypothetical protein